MECIAELNFDRVTPEETGRFKIRETARGVIINPEGKIALLKARDGYYKLPGGKIEETENAIEALRRECLEEAGVMLSDIFELGFVKEIRGGDGVIQISYAYKARTKGEARLPQLTESEKEKGLELVWLAPANAIRKVEKIRSENPQGRYIAARELAILRASQT